MIERVVITGANGSGASYLADYILENHPETEIHGFVRWRSGAKDRLNPGVTLHEVDLLDVGSIIRALRMSWPSAIFHLASHANVRSGFDTPLSVLHNNIMGTANLLEAVRLSYFKPIFVMCSSSEVYGQVPREYVPITESCPINPASPYAVSKLTQDALSHTYFLSYKIPVVRTRMFSYFNPRRADLFATSFARQIVDIERGKAGELIHGNLESIRTLIDIRDACSAYWSALRCTPGEVYNIGGDNTITVGELLETLKTHAKCKIPSRADPKLYRPTDVTLQIPDSSKFRNKTHWKPQYTLEQSIEHLLNHVRAQ